MRVTILDDYFDTVRHLPAFQKVASHDVTIWNDHLQETGPLAARLQETEALVLIRERTQIRADLLEQLPSLRLVSQRGSYPHLDVDACTRLGIVVSSAQGDGQPSYATMELTWGLIIAAMRELPAQIASLKAGEWQMGVGRSLRGKTLSVYGYGRIGRVVADVGRAFGMRVQFWGREESHAGIRADGYEVATSRAAFFESSDVVTVHVRMIPETRGLITAEDLGRMRPDALFVNTSRAALLEPGALVAALRAGRPGMAAVDVFDEEPLRDTADPLLTMPNVIATPHIGYVTREDWDNQFSDIFDQVVAFASGSPIHVVNPDVLSSPQLRGLGER